MHQLGEPLCSIAWMLLGICLDENTSQNTASQPKYTHLLLRYCNPRTVDGQLDPVKQDIRNIQERIVRYEQKLAVAEQAGNKEEEKSLINLLSSLQEKENILLRSQAPSGIRSDADVARMRQLLQETAGIKLWPEERKAGAYSVVTLARLWLEGLVHGYERVHDD
ncbi:hypothetical protein ABBQ38_004631 [Trebouxia sp. C0009 RCD-2024]